MRRSVFVGVAIALALVALAFARPQVAMATQTIFVNTADDVAPTPNDDLCSLRAAITVSLANSNAADTDCTTGLTGPLPDVIQIDPDLAGSTLSLGSPLPTIANAANNAIEIIGPTTDASDFLISGADAHRVLELGTTTLTLDNLTITKGNGVGTVPNQDGFGGAIWGHGTIQLTLNNVFITDSHAGFRGGGAYLQGAATLTNNGGAYVGNSSGENGGAIFGFEGPFIYNGYALLMDGNHAGGKGGAIALNADENADFTHIERSLLRNNTATSGGGVFYSEPTIATNIRSVLELTDSTVTGNDMVFMSLDFHLGFTFLRDTFVDNGSLFYASRGFMANSIVVGGVCHNTNDIALFEGSRNLISPNHPPEGGDGCLLHNTRSLQMGSLGIEPTGLSPLAQHGGPEVQQTYALQAGSNAIDFGDPAYCGTIDARSIPRGINGVGDVNSPVVGDCDIGAYEYAPYVVNFVTNVSSVNEGDGSKDVQVKLSIPDASDRPLADDLVVPVEVTGDSSARSPQDYTLEDAFALFPAGSTDGDIVNVTVGVTQNAVAGRYAKNVILELESAAGTAIAEPKQHKVSITDDDQPGVVASDGGNGTSVSEATPGTADTFSVALQSQPDCIQTDPEDIFSCGDPADVTAHVQPDRDCTIKIGDDSGAEGTPVNFTILNANWQQGTSISVKAIDDPWDEDLRDESATHTCRITFTFSSGDPLYDATTDVYDVKVHDNDVAGVTLTQADTNGLLNEGTAEENTYTLVLDTPPDPGKPLPSTPRGATKVIVTPSAGCSLGNGGGVAKNFSFTDADWDFPQTVEVTAVNNVTVELLHTCTLTTTISSPDPVYQNLGADPSLLPTLTPFSIQDYAPPGNTDDPPFIDVSSGGGVSVAEASSSTSDSFTLVLERRPLSNVVINLGASRDVHISGPQVLFQAPGDLSPAATTSVTFTPSDWDTAQTIKVFAVNDDYDESLGLFPVTVTPSGVTTVAAGFSDSSLRRFVLDGGSPAESFSLPVAITDNDTSAVNVSETNGGTAVTEGGASDSLSVALATHPYEDVTLDVSAGDQCTAVFDGAAGDGHELTIAAADWATPVGVTVTAVDDDVVETSPLDCPISFTASSFDGLYDAISVAGVTAHVTDNDLEPAPVASFTWSSRGGLAPFHVELDASGSTDTVPIVKYRWTFGDGTRANGMLASHDYTVPGLYWIKLQIVDELGAKSTFQESFRAYAFSWAGGLVEPPALNSAVAGARVRVVFSVGGYAGFDVREVDEPQVQRVDCGTGAPIGRAFHATHYGPAAIVYNKKYGTYTYRWKTKAAWAGTCRQFQLTLVGGVTHTLVFDFRVPTL